MEKIEKNAFVIFGCTAGPVSTNAYLVICKKTNDAAVIDCSPGSFEKLLPHIQKHKARISKIILTHSHWDHIADVSKFCNEFHPKVCVHPEDAQNVEVPGSDGLRTLPTIERVNVCTKLNEGEKVAIGDTQWNIIHTPGHSPGGICLYNEQEHVLFSGDTLFKGTIGRLDLPTSEPDRIWASLEKLAALPEETEVYSGHGPKTTIGQEAWLKRAKEYLM